MMHVYVIGQFYLHLTAKWDGIFKLWKILVINKQRGKRERGRKREMSINPYILFVFVILGVKVSIHSVSLILTIFCWVAKLCPTLSWCRGLQHTRLLCPAITMVICIKLPPSDRYIHVLKPSLHWKVMTMSNYSFGVQFFKKAD